MAAPMRPCGYHRYQLMIIPFIVLCFGTLISSAADRTWNGPEDGDWFNAANWTPSDSWPQAGEVVLINNGSVRVTNSTANVAQLTILNATLTLRHWTTELRATSVTVAEGGVIQPDGPFTDAEGASNRVHIVCTHLTVDEHGVIHADERGFFKDADANHGIGPGAGEGHAADQVAGGGGHGGRGGSVYRKVNGILVDTFAGGESYGSLLNPTHPGSSGGGIFQRRGGAGGGAIRIDASEAVLINGRVSANGENGIARTARSGAGSGGSIWISSDSFGGITGTIEARGGSGVISGGGGGGGRVAIEYEITVMPVGIVFDVSGGIGFKRDMTAPRAAEMGTLSLPDLNVFANVWHNQIKGAYLHVPGFSSWSSSVLTVSNAVVGLPSYFELNINDLKLESGSGLLLSRSHDLELGDLFLREGSYLRLQTNSLLTCSSLELKENAALRLLDQSELMCQGTIELKDGARLSLHTNSIMTTVGGIFIGAAPDQFAYAPQHSNFQTFGTNVSMIIGGDISVNQGLLWFEQHTQLQGSGDLLLTGASKLTFLIGETNSESFFGGNIEVAGNMTLEEASWIYPWSFHTGLRAGTLRLAMNHLMIADGSGIDGDGKGYRHERGRQYGDGPGAGLYNLGEGLGHGPGSGGGHGGRGGFNSFDLTGGMAYGSSSAPITPGSSGAGGWASQGGSGGSAVWIDAVDEVIVDGQITVNGTNGTGGYNGDGGGGAGGSVFIRCLRLRGSETGTITANGGSGLGGNQNNGGGGAGGRIAVWSNVPIVVPLNYPGQFSGPVIVTHEPMPIYQGAMTADSGTGWYNTPDEQAAEAGSIAFFTMRRGSVMMFQ